MRNGNRSVGICENRLIALNRIGENLKELGNDTMETYIKGPVRRGNIPQAVFGPFAGATRGILEVGDAVAAGILDQQLESPKSNRIGRDIAELGKDTADAAYNVVTLRPLQALKSVGRGGLDIYRLVFNDLILDVIDTGGGYDVYRKGGRSTAKAPESYATAA